MFTPLLTDSSKKYGNNRWLAYSNKLKRTVFLFSDLEYEHWLNVEFNPNVISFCEQPLKVNTIINDKDVSSIFDMWILYKDGNEEFVEIKYSSDLKKEKVQKQLEIQRDWCEKNQKNQRVVTEMDLKQPPIKISNIKLMLKLIRNPIGNKDLLKMTKAILKETNKKLTLEEISVQLQIPLNVTLKVVSFLIYHNEIKSDIHIKPFGKKTEVWI